MTILSSHPYSVIGYRIEEEYRSLLNVKPAGFLS